MGSIPGGGTKIPQASWRGQKNELTNYKRKRHFFFKKALSLSVMVLGGGASGSLEGGAIVMGLAPF